MVYGRRVSITMSWKGYDELKNFNIGINRVWSWINRYSISFRCLWRMSTWWWLGRIFCRVRNRNNNWFYYASYVLSEEIVRIKCECHISVYKDSYLTRILRSMKERHAIFFQTIFPSLYEQNVNNRVSWWLVDRSNPSNQIWLFLLSFDHQFSSYFSDLHYGLLPNNAWE